MLNSRTCFTIIIYLSVAVLSLGIGLQAGLGAGLTWFGLLTFVVTAVISTLRYLGGK